MNIEVLTQHSIESHSDDRDDDSDTSSYKEYEEQIKKLSAYKLPYATVSINDKDNEEHIFENMVKRKPEPLYVGDVIEFNRWIDGFKPDKMINGTVESIERRGRMVTVDIGETIHSFSYIRRIAAYDKETNTMKNQDGLMRRVEDYDLITEIPSIHVGKIKSFWEIGREKHIERNDQNMLLKVHM